MSESQDFYEFQRSIHQSEWWQMDEADAQVIFAPYEQVAREAVTPERAYELGLLVAQELQRLHLIAKALALEPHPVSAYGTPEKGVTSGKSRLPKSGGRTSREITITANQGKVELLNRKLSVAQARELGARLIQTADTIDLGDTERPVLEEGTP